MLTCQMVPRVLQPAARPAETSQILHALVSRSILVNNELEAVVTRLMSRRAQSLVRATEEVSGIRHQLEGFMEENASPLISESVFTLRRLCASIARIVSVTIHGHT